jgi:ribosome-associated heat shock protein Hsp15
MGNAPVSQRLDKWLWAARFFKTRSLAATAIDAGHVRVNGNTAKRAREIRAGDRLQIAIGHSQYEVVVRGLNEYRRPAPEARRLYEETPESATRRQEQETLQALAPTLETAGRPTKRDRRQLGRLADRFR